MVKTTGIVMSMFMLVLLISAAHFDKVMSDAADCLDGCSTACVNFSNSRLQARCDRKCQIRCGPDLEAGHRKQIKAGDVLLD